MFKIFEIKDGKTSFFPILNPKNIKGFFIVSIIMIFAVALSGWLKIDEKDIWKFYNLLIQQFGLKNQIPPIDRPKEIEARIELEVDNAIRDVTPEYDRIISEADQKYKPRYVDEKNDESVCYTDECKALAPPMRICSVWVDDCPKD
jgi:hypothetical protein